MLTNEELIESIIVDLNNIPKYLIDGQFIASCDLISKMAQKLYNLKTGIHNDIKSRDASINSLKKTLAANGIKIVDVPVENLQFDEKDGVNNG